MLWHFSVFSPSSCFFLNDKWYENRWTKKYVCAIHLIWKYLWLKGCSINRKWASLTFSLMHVSRFIAYMTVSYVSRRNLRWYFQSIIRKKNVLVYISCKTKTWSTHPAKVIVGTFNEMAVAWKRWHFWSTTRTGKERNSAVKSGKRSHTIKLMILE